MTELEYAGLVLEDQLLDHLATPEGAMEVWKERLSPDLINESDDGIRMTLSFVLGYIDQYGEAPGRVILSEETGYDDFEVPVAPVGYVIDKLRQRHTKREAKAAIKKVARAVDADPKTALKQMFSESARIIGETTSQKDVLTSADADTVLTEYHTRREYSELGLSYGFPEMNKALGGGFQLGKLYAVVARTGRYKSWMLLKSAFETWQNGHDVSFQTMEMPPEEMYSRFLCMVAGVSWDQFMNYAIPPNDLKLLEDAAKWVKEQPQQIHFVANQPGERTIPHIVQTAQQQNAAMLYVDQLSFIEGTTNFGAEQNWLKIHQICLQLKDATRHFPIFYAAQLNRKADLAKSVKDLDPAMFGLSDAIGNTADIAFGLFSNKDMMPNRIVQYGVVKGRSFAPRAWEMKVDLSLNTNFRMLAELDLEDL